MFYRLFVPLNRLLYYLHRHPPFVGKYSSQVLHHIFSLATQNEICCYHLVGFAVYERHVSVDRKHNPLVVPSSNASFALFALLCSFRPVFLNGDICFVCVCAEFSAEEK